MNYIFGYGSIINDESRRSTLGTSTHSSGDNECDDFAVCAFLSHKYARRHWNYRCSTGFTALGLELREECKCACDVDSTGTASDVLLDDAINGVLYPVCPDQLIAFDAREIGYYRALVPLDMIRVSVQHGSVTARQRAERLRNCLETNDIDITIWVYVPCPSHYALPDEDFPILQTYVDVCIRGCLQWGGQPLADHFVLSTHSWSDCFLNDAPLSRRPWLHRLDYAAVDSCLSRYSDYVKLECRRHPEEFASLHGAALKAGLWGVAPRNNLFVAREAFLCELHERLCGGGGTARTQGGVGGGGRAGVRQMEIVGMGGVGKSQVSIEYAHRHYGSFFGFVAFIRAESTASIAADLRRLAHDMGILPVSSLQMSLRPEGGTEGARRAVEGRDVEVSREDLSLDDEAIAEEIKRRLARSRHRWLLIFDNVEDADAVSPYLPRGMDSSRGAGGGFVLVTSRIAHTAWLARGSAMVLNCFGSQESVRFLRMALKVRSGSVDQDGDSVAAVRQAGEGIEEYDTDDDNELRALACRMGHLPLALWTAGAYMRRCDVSSGEYIRRFDSTLARSIHLGHSSGDAIAACFHMTVDKISQEVNYYSEVLLCIGFLAPDISKRMVKVLLSDYHLRAAHGGAETSVQWGTTGTLDQSAVTRSHSENCDDNRKQLLAYLKCGTMTCGVCVIGMVVFFVPSLSYLSLRDVQMFGFGLMAGCTVACALIMLYLHTHSLRGSPTQMIACNEIEIVASPECKASTFIRPTAAPPPSCLSVNKALLATQALADDVDKLWDLMRQFSLLSALRGPLDDSRIGTVHRLQQAVLRSRAKRGSAIDTNSPIAEIGCMERCVWMLSEMWDFDALDPLTWDSAGNVLEHFETLSRHVLEGIYALHQSDISGTRALAGALSQQCAQRFATLLTSGGEYASIVLSRFDIAQHLLEAACSLHMYVLRPHLVKYPDTHVSFDDIDMCMVDNLGCDIDKVLLLESIGDTLHMLGKALRYNGLLSNSENCLKKALRIRKKNCATDGAHTGKECLSASMTGSIKVSETMYELGVLHLRMHSLYTAKSHLALSLELLCRLKEDSCIGATERPSPSDHSSLRRLQSREAAVLHQLGVVATLERRYEDAEGYLLEALSMMTGREDCDDTQGKVSRERGGKMSIARAATLQQLGKVALRRGALSTARNNLMSALEIYKAVYGENRCTSHVNVATVLKHLGSTAMASKQYESASEYFADTLAAREKIAGEGSSGGIDVILAVQSLGQAEMECGRWDAAEGLFLRAKVEAERELTALRDSNSSEVEKENGDGASKADPLMKQQSFLPVVTALRASLVKVLFFSTHSLKGIYSKMKRPDLAAQMTKEVRALKLAHSMHADKHSTNKGKEEANAKMGCVHATDDATPTVMFFQNASIRVTCQPGVTLQDHAVQLLSDLLHDRHVVRMECRSILKVLQKYRTRASDSSAPAPSDVMLSAGDVTAILSSCTQLTTREETNDLCRSNHILVSLKQRHDHFSSRANELFRMIASRVNTGSASYIYESFPAACSPDLFQICKYIFAACDELRSGCKDIGILVDDVS